MPAPIELTQIRSFLAVHRTGSFSAAAKAAGVPRSTISRAIAGLERALGAPLFYRTTRKVSATAAGDALAARIGAPVSALDAALDGLPGRGDEPSGVLRVTTTVDIGRAVLAEAVLRFTARYPTVEVEMHLSNQLVDLVGRGFDVALRVLARPPRDSTLIARKVGTLALGLYASPAYLARRGTPRREADLAHHDGLRTPGPTALTAARITCDDMLVARQLLRAGAGIGVLPSFLADPDLASGALVRVLPAWDVRTGVIYIVTPGHTQPAPKVRAFRSLLLETLRQRPISAPA